MPPYLELLVRLYNLSIIDKLLDPANSHPSTHFSISTGHRRGRLYSHALLRISKLLVITHQMFLVPRVLLHPHIVVNRLEDDLAKAVEVGKVYHLRVEKLGH